MFPKDTDDIPLYTFVNAGLCLYNNNKEFEAHEVWEYAWKVEVGRKKLVLQALIQIAAAVHKQKIGVPRGTEKLLLKASAKIDEILSAGACFLGVDLQKLKKEVARSLAEATGLCQGTASTFSKPSLPKSVAESGFVYLHGFASSPRSKKALSFAPAVEAEGHRIHVPDQNEGDFRALTLTRAIACAKRFIFDETVLIGSSMGAQVALRVAEKDDRIKALVLMAPAFDLAASMDRRYPPEKIALWKAQGMAPVPHYGTGRVEPLAYSFYEDAKSYQTPPKIRVPAFILHGRHDDTIPIEEVRAHTTALDTPLDFHEVDDDHSLLKTWHLGLEAALQFASALGFKRNEGAISVETAQALLAQIEADS